MSTQKVTPRLPIEIEYERYRKGEISYGEYRVLADAEDQERLRNKRCLLR